MIGHIQFIAKGFNGSYDNIDNLFFNDFHHVARWKLVVKEKVSPEENEKIVVRYIPKGNGILSDCINFSMVIEEIEKIVIPSDHLKYYNNQTDKGCSPPSLIQQCLIVIDKLKK